MPKKEFNTYRVNIVHGLWSDAAISCYKDATYLGTIYFMKNNVKEPTINSNGAFLLYYPSDKFDSILDLCREESPVYIEIWGSTNKYCMVTTNKEPVGEEEGN